MELNKIYLGDNIETLKLFPDESIDCCITSPPYYGLRDYGTGTWVGGDPNCPHKRMSKQSDKTITGHSQEELIGNVGDAIYKDICPLCGAVREDKQVGLEETPEEYIERLVNIFREVKRVLKDDGTLWVNIGDSYNGSGGNHSVGQNNSSGFQGVLGEKYGGRGNHISSCKPKDLIGIPWMLAFALRADGWYLRQDIIWHKPNPMPESVKDRCTKSHEYIFLLSKSSKYYFDHDAIQEDCNYPNANGMKFGGDKYGKDAKGFEIYSGNEYSANGKRNKRDVWSVIPAHYKEAHFATFPEELVFPMILAGCPTDGVVLDPFMGSGTTAVVAKTNHRNYIGCELNPEYVKMAENRIKNTKKRLF